MRVRGWNEAVLIAGGLGLGLLMTACGGGGSGTTTPPPPPNYVLTVDSAIPASGVVMTITSSNTALSSQGTTSFSLTYSSGTAVILKAPATAGGNNFSKWTGCTSTSTVTCNVTMSANTVTATYVAPTVVVTPNPGTATIEPGVQFSATVNGAASTAVSWSVAAPSGSSFSAGTISASGLYTTPYPAPPTVTVTATSTADTTQTGSATVTLPAPATAAYPALTVDAGSQTHAINPFIYGMSYYNSSSDTAAAESISLPVDRWGGDGSQRYNYQLDVINSASDYYFENHLGNTGVEDTGTFNTAVAADKAIGAKTLGTVDVLGWVSKDGSSCSPQQPPFPSSFRLTNTIPIAAMECTRTGSAVVRALEDATSQIRQARPALPAFPWILQHGPKPG